MWPWNRRLAEAERELAEADVRAKQADELAEESRVVGARYWQQVEKNGFTELFQQAMRRKGA